MGEAVCEIVGRGMSEMKEVNNQKQKKEGKGKKAGWNMHFQFAFSLDFCQPVVCVIRT